MAYRLKCLALFSLMFPLAFANAAPDSSAPYQAGTHYEVLDPAVRTSDPKRIEVVEIFWYGCSHCYNFEPLVKAWHEKQDADVNFVHSPAIWRPVMALHARAYYTAKALKVLDKVHLPIFEAMNLKRNKLASKGAIAKIFIEQGIDEATFNKTFDSFGVTSATKQADARQRNYHTQGTPEVVVNGKYRINARMAGSHQGLLKVADYLVEMERKNNSAASN